MNEFFALNEAGSYAFFRIPKELICGERYKNLPPDAALLYGLLLDRLELSRRNGWVDKQGYVYQIYPVKDLVEDLGFCKEKVCKLLSRLEQYQLLHRVKQGMSKPDLLYVRHF